MPAPHSAPFLVVIAAAVSILSAVPARGATDPFETDATEVLPPATTVLARVLAAFPPDPLVLRGDLVVLDRKGDTVRSQSAEIRLDWNAAVPTAEFSVRDAFGAPVERLIIRRPPGAAPAYELYTGSSGTPNRTPDLSGRIGGTDFTWEDLSLDCLWWTKGDTIETHMKKGRKCYVVDLKPPAPRPDLSRVRLFVDSEVYAILRAEAYDSRNELTRRMEVKSLQKINEQWTLQDLEMRRYPSDQRTMFRAAGLPAADSSDAETGLLPSPSQPVEPVNPVPETKIP